MSSGKLIGLVVVFVVMFVITLFVISMVDLVLATDHTDQAVVDYVQIGNDCHVYARSETGVYKVSIPCNLAYYFQPGDHVLVTFKKGPLLGQADRASVSKH